MTLLIAWQDRSRYKVAGLRMPIDVTKGP